MRGATAVWAIVARDLRVELRGRELLPALAQFIVSAAFLLAALVFYFVNFSAMNELIKVLLS